MVEQEEDVLLLVFKGVELAGTLEVGFVSEVDSLGEVSDAAVIICDFGNVVFTLIVVKIFALHSIIISFIATREVTLKPRREAPSLRGAGVEPTPPKTGRGIGWLSPSHTTTKEKNQKNFF